MKQGITLRMGAAHYDVTVGDVQVDLRDAHKDTRYIARRTIIEGLKQKGYFGEKQRKKAIYRARQEAVKK